MADAATARLIKPYIHDDEVVFDLSPALWRELLVTVISVPTGILAATDRRLVIAGEYTQKVTSFVYEELESIGLHKKLVTADLNVLKKDGQSSTFNASKTFLVGVQRIVVDCSKVPPPIIAPVQLRYIPGAVKYDLKSFQCSRCMTEVGFAWNRCPAFMCPLDWQGSKEAVQKFAAEHRELKEEQGD